jgi:hypothetical protein
MGPLAAAVTHPIVITKSLQTGWPNFPRPRAKLKKRGMNFCFRLVPTAFNKLLNTYFYDVLVY